MYLSVGIIQPKPVARCCTARVLSHWNAVGGGDLGTKPTNSYLNIEDTGMENFDNIPSNHLKVEVTHLVNTLASNAGLYDSDDVLGALYVLRMKVQKSSQKRVLQKEVA